MVNCDGSNCPYARGIKLYVKVDEGKKELRIKYSPISLFKPLYIIPKPNYIGIVMTNGKQRTMFNSYQLDFKMDGPDYVSKLSDEVFELIINNPAYKTQMVALGTPDCLTIVPEKNN